MMKSIRLQQMTLFKRTSFVSVQLVCPKGCMECLSKCLLQCDYLAGLLLERLIGSPLAESFGCANSGHDCLSLAFLNYTGSQML